MIAVLCRPSHAWNARDARNACDACDGGRPASVFNRRDSPDLEADVNADVIWSRRFV